MIIISRQFNLKYFCVFYINKCTKFINNVTFRQNKLCNLIVSYPKHKMFEFSNNRRFSFKYLYQGYFVFITALCFEKENDVPKEKKQEENVQQNNEKCVLFMDAAKFGNVQDIKRLIREGVDVNQRHPYGWTALHVAAINGHFRVVAELLSNGADPNLGDNFSVDEVAWEKQLESEDVMAVRKLDFFTKMKMEGNCVNFTALHYAVLIHDDDIVSLLLRSGADPTFVSETGFSPLDFAKSNKMKYLLKKYMEKDDEDIMKLHSSLQRLVKKGYSVNITTPENEQKGGNPSVIGPIKLQIKKIDTDKIIKDIKIDVKLKNFVTV